MRRLFKRLGVKRINKAFRFSRSLYFRCLDLLGERVFFLLRFIGAISKTGEFKKDSIKKILIVRVDRIGDVILSTPALRALRRGFPLARICLLVSEYTKDLVVNNPNIDELLIYGKNRITNDYDLAVALHPGYRQNFITFASGAKYRIGYTGSAGSFFLTHKLADDRETRIRHEVESALEVAGSLGCVADNKDLEISITEEGERFADNFFHENNLKADDSVAVIHPGARQEYIRWRKRGFAEVADKLIKQENVKVILIGSKEEKPLAEEVSSLMEAEPLFAVGLELTQLISLIKRSNLFIGNSTGPMHIAAALNTSVIAIFGNIHPLDSYHEWGPWGKGHIVVSGNLNCPDCHPGDCRDYKCMDLISAQQVFQLCQELLKKTRNQS